MDNQDNANCPIFQMSNRECFSPIKESPNKILYQGNDYKYTPNRYIPLGSTPSKKMDINNGFFPSLVQTPVFSPHRVDGQFQNYQYQQRALFYNDYSSSFRPTFLSPNNNQRISDKKSPTGNISNEYNGWRGINLTDKFDQVKNDEQTKNNINVNNDINSGGNFYENINKNNIGENDINNKIKYKKILFNDEDSSSFQENNNENLNNENIHKNLSNKKIINNIILHNSSVLLSDIKSVYGSNLSKNEYVFNSLNSSIMTNFSLSKKDNTPNKKMDQMPVQNNKSKQRPLKNSEQANSNIGSTTNMSTSERAVSRCTCKNSNCLKFYCECFANGRFCENCLCINCKNTQEYKDLRLEKYNLIISRNPKAIQKINSTKRSWTCKCRNSNCSKKYCDCFQNGRSCTSKCKCINCLNKNINGNRNKNNGGEKKIKRIRGMKKDKINKLINRRFKRKKIIVENNNYEINNENNINNSNIEDKKLENPLINFNTPKKPKNNLDKNDIYYYYKSVSTTAALTQQKERKKLFFDSKTEKKRKDIYTKLQMDNI